LSEGTKNISETILERRTVLNFLTLGQKLGLNFNSFRFHGLNSPVLFLLFQLIQQLS